MCHELTHNTQNLNRQEHPIRLPLHSRPPDDTLPGKDPMSKPPQDRIYASVQPRADFVFDERVAEVFTDMINRSVPGYATILSMIGVLADRYCVKGSTVYDLGCSLGGAALSMFHHISEPDYHLVAVDNSRPMIERFRKALAQQPAAERIELLCADVTDIEIEDASVVVLNFTLQFIPPAQR